MYTGIQTSGDVHSITHANGIFDRPPIGMRNCSADSYKTCTFQFQCLIPIGDLSKNDLHGHRSPSGYGALCFGKRARIK